MLRTLATLLLAGLISGAAYGQSGAPRPDNDGAQSVRLGPGDYRWIPFNVRHPPAEIDCSFKVLSGGATVHVELMPGSEFRLFARGREHDAITKTPDARSGEFRQLVIDPGRYALVLSNRDNAQPATVALHFETKLNPSADLAQTLSPARRATVILISIAVFFGMVSWSVRSLLKATGRHA